jgi:3-oxoacyl-[acyl-carrier-protein] synthase II
MKRREVVVTGIGCIGPWGIGMQGLAKALQRGEPLSSPIDRAAGYHREGAATLLAGCGGLDLSPWLDAQQARRMSIISQYAVATARMALQDAGLRDVRSDRTAIALATAFGPGTFTEQLARQILEKGGKAASPFLFTDCVANAASGQIAIDLGARGPNATICQREAGPLLALAHGAHDVAAGRADVCLAGAVDEMSPLSHAILDRFRALARPGGAGEVPRPFDRRRRGVLAGEGATILVLEAEAAARARDARILCRVGPTVRVFDPSAGRASFGQGHETLAKTLLGRLAFKLCEVDTVVSSASGARRGDALEAAVLRRACPQRSHVLVPKAVHGEYGGGTLAAGLLALRGAEFGFPPACSEPDPALGIAPTSGFVHARRILCSALAAGGAAAWSILEAP